MFSLPPTEVIYVAPDGHDYAADGYSTPDNDKAHPWGSIYMAIRRAQPGDTIEVAPGTYTENVGWGAKPATADQPIVLKGNGNVTVNGSLQLVNADYWTVTGIAFYGGASQFVVKFDGGDGWTIDDCEISGGRGVSNLMVIGNPHDYKILNNKIHDVFTGPKTMNYHNVYMMPGYKSGPGLIEGNTIWAAHNGANIKIGPGSSGVGGSNITVRNNTMSHAGAGVTIGGKSSNLMIGNNTISGGLTTGRNAGIMFNKWKGSKVTGLKTNTITGYKYKVRYDYPG